VQYCNTTCCYHTHPHTHTTHTHTHTTLSSTVSPTDFSLDGFALGSEDSNDAQYDAATVAGMISGTVFVVVFIVVVAGIMYLRRQGPKPTSDPGSIRNVSYNPNFSPPTVDIYKAEHVSDGNVDSVDDGDVDVDMDDKPVEKQMSAPDDDNMVSTEEVGKTIVEEAKDVSNGKVDSVDDGDVDMNDKPVEKQMSALYDNDDAIYDTAGLTTSEPTVDENALYDMAGMTTTVDAAVDEATYDIATTTAKPPADPDSTQLITSI